MHIMAATLVVSDPVYTPIFERIEHELASFESKDDVIRRARAVADRYRAIA